MSAQLRDLNKQMEDKEFVKAYFAGVESGQDVTNKLVQDGATLNSPDLIAKLVGWLADAEGTPDANAQAQVSQQVASLNLPSQREKEEKEDSSSEDAEQNGGESSDGATRQKTAPPITDQKVTDQKEASKSNFKFGDK